jgi:hypothetical protein
MRHVVQLLCALPMPLDICVFVGLVANVLDMICDGMRGCMYEKRAPFPGPCHAFAGKARGPRIADERADRCLPSYGGELTLYRHTRHDAEW